MARVCEPSRLHLQRNGSRLHLQKQRSTLQMQPWTGQNPCGGLFKPLAKQGVQGWLEMGQQAWVGSRQGLA